MNNKGQKFFARVSMLALVALLPLTAFAQDNGRGRGKPDEVFVNGHDARDGRTDKNNGQRRADRRTDNDRDNGRNQAERNRAEEWRRQEAERLRLEQLRRQEELRRQQERNRNNNDWRRNNDNYGRNDQYDRNRRGRNWDQYGGYGGSFQLRQTALNAGYNNGIQEGRKDRSRGERFDYRDEGDYQRATEDYSSRLGDRSLYQRYFREGFANGYEDGYRGY